MARKMHFVRSKAFGLHRVCLRASRLFFSITQVGTQILRQAVAVGHDSLRCAGGRHDTDAAGDVGGESVGQQMPGRFEADAAGAEIENLLFIHRAGRRAVRAFHIVGVNLQRGLEFIRASSLSSSDLLVCLESVFWARGGRGFCP